MRALPLSARLYVGATIALGATLVVWLGPRSNFDNIPLFIVLLLTSAHHLRLQGQPAAREERLDDVGVLRGGLRVAAAARPERNHARRRDERVEPVHVPDEDQEPGLPDAVQHGVPRHHRPGLGLRLRIARRRARHARARRVRPRQAAGRRGDDVFHFQHLPDRHRGVARHQAVVHLGVEPELPVERAELFRRRRRGGHRHPGR